MCLTDLSGQVLLEAEEMYAAFKQYIALLFGTNDESRSLYGLQCLLQQRTATS